MSAPRETDLYLPVKAFLEGQGYVVKAEVGAADVVAVRGGAAAGRRAEAGVFADAGASVRGANGGVG